MRVIEAIRARLRAEDGYTMIAVIGAISLVSMLAAATLAATEGDLNLTQRDIDLRRATAAAQAGIANYSFHLNNDNSYWARCTSVPEPNAVNQVGSTTKRRKVPGSTDAEYAIELLPSSTFVEGKCNTSKPVESMLEQGGTNTGSFRIRSTGYAGDAEVSLVATYKRASFLDYIYFTQYETSDPITYGNVSWLSNAYKQCGKFRREGRESQPISGSSNQYCNRIVFVTGDHIEGPLHTNDDLAICGTPEFGRTAADVIEVGAPPEGWMNGECSSPSGANPKFIGPLVTTAPVLKPPTTNSKLEKIAGATYTYSCQTKIELTGSTMKVTKNNGSNSTSTSTVSFPSEGVVYIKGGSCPGSQWSTCQANEYSPFTATYPSGSDCGTVYVKGHYSKELTIAAQGDIVVEGDLTRDSGSQGLLGLIANNFVRIKHECSGFKLENLKVEAAILAIEHSFIVDHYDCGSSLGSLTVKGAISQKYRGPVGTTGSSSTGYLKKYEYDDRLRYMEPPNFLNPVEPSWHIQRETLDF